MALFSKRVLFISARSDYGGGPEVLYVLATGIQEHGFNAYIAAPRGEPYFALFSQIAVAPVFEIPCRRLSVRSLVELFRYCRKHKIEVIHSHGKGAGLYARLLRFFLPCKIIHTFHSIHFYNEKSGLLKFINYCAERLLSHLTDRYICISNSERGIAESFLKIAPDRISQIENGIDFNKFHSARRAKRDNFYKILMISRLCYQKNIELAIDAVPYVRNTRFSINVAGDGENKPDLLRRIGELGNPQLFRLLGFRDNISELLSEFDIFLSTSRWEGMPLTLIEASAAQIPCIVTDVIGNNDVITNETGYLVQARPADVAQAIDYVISHYEEALAKAAKASLLARERFGRNRMVASHAQVYSGTSWAPKVFTGRA